MPIAATDAALLLDTSTLRSAAAALSPGDSRWVNSSLLDIDLTALGHVVDSLVLADSVHYLADQRATAAVHRLKLDNLPFFQGVELPDQLLTKLEASPTSLNAHRYLWQAPAEDQAKLFELIGVTFEAVTARGHDFVNSCRKAAYEYLVGVSADSSSLLQSINDWHGRSHWFNTHQAAFNANLNERLRLLEYKIGHHLRYPDYYAWPDDVRFQISAEDETARLLYVLHWLIDRGVFYSLAASAMGLTYFPSSLRSNLLALTSLGLGDERVENTAIQFLVKQLGTTLDSSVHWLLFRGQKTPLVSLARPPFFQYCCAKVDRAEDVLSHALELRDRPEAASLRQALRAIGDARRAGDNRRLQEITDEFEWFSRKMCAWMTSRSVTVSPEKVLRFFGVPLDLFDDLIVSLKTPPIFQKPFFPGRPHLALLRDVTTDLLEVYSLGASYERLFRRSGA